MQNAETRLIAYGTLRPGRSNHHVVADIPGDWVPGRIEGYIDKSGHYPRYRPMRNGQWHDVEILVSPALPRYWRRIDRFEGPHYRRVIIPVSVRGKWCYGSVYVGRTI